MPEARSILFIPDANTDDRSSQAAASIELGKVDIAVAGNGGIIKDRHGDGAEVLLALRAAMAVGELSSKPTPTLLGVPLNEVAALTIDGAHWFEVFGPTLQLSAPSGGPVLRFRIAQTPGGKKGRFGVSQGDTIAVREIAVRGVQRKGGEPLGEQPPLAVQPLCVCGHRHDQHGHEARAGGTACRHGSCRCGEFRPRES